MDEEAKIESEMREFGIEDLGPAPEKPEWHLGPAPEKPKWTLAPAPSYPSETEMRFDEESAVMHHRIEKGSLESEYVTEDEYRGCLDESHLKSNDLIVNKRVKLFLRLRLLHNFFLDTT